MAFIGFFFSGVYRITRIFQLEYTLSLAYFTFDMRRFIRIFHYI